MYKQVFDPKYGVVAEGIIQRTSDNTFIPFDPDNTDYQAYLEWLSEGNQPLPADEGITPA